MKRARPGFIPHRRGSAVREANVLEYHYKNPIYVPANINRSTGLSHPRKLRDLPGLCRLGGRLPRIHLRSPPAQRAAEEFVQPPAQPLSPRSARQPPIGLRGFFSAWPRSERFSDCKARADQDYLADQPESLGESMAFFFDRIVGATRIIAGDPAAFVSRARPKVAQ